MKDSFFELDWFFSVRWVIRYVGVEYIVNNTLI